MQIFRDVKITMRDGVNLAANVFLPDGNGPWPVVLVRTAYNRNFVYESAFLRRGIALIAKDCRGRYESEGNFYPFVNEADGGYDTLE